MKDEWSTKNWTMMSATTPSLETHKRTNSFRIRYFSSVVVNSRSISYLKMMTASFYYMPPKDMVIDIFCICDDDPNLPKEKIKPLNLNMEEKMITKKKRERSHLLQFLLIKVLPPLTNDIRLYTIKYELPFVTQ